jgi:endonuclease G
MPFRGSPIVVRSFVMTALRRPFSFVAALGLASLLGCCKATPPGPTARGGPTSGAEAQPRERTRTRPNEGGLAPSPTAGAPTGGAGLARSAHLALGIPTRLAGADRANELLLVKPQYALSYNPSRNGPSWVAWQLNGSHLGPVTRYRGPFAPEPALPEGVYQVRHDDYTGSGYDRGHLCPSDDRTATPDDNRATFTLSNIVPQTHDNNAGPWLRLESYSRALVEHAGRELFVTAGGVFGAQPKTLRHGVAVPDAVFKIVVVLAPGQGPRDVTAETRVISVLIPNVTGIASDGWGKYRTSLEAVERASGFAFLTDVAPGVHTALAAKIDAGPTD